MSADDQRIGRELQGRYKIVAALASGGMGVVYKGERLGLGRPVAIKFLHSWIAAQPDTLKRFETEARAASRLSHPNCAAVTDFGVDDGAPYLVMDYVVGATLRSVTEKGPAAPDRAIHIVRQILAGLSHAHGNDIVHRDIKPDNVILTEATGVGDHVRILDFGLAKLTDSSSAMTAGFAVGTPSYMAPEQQVGDPVDARTDVYAVGIMLHELLTGKKPYVGKDIGETFKLHRDAPIPNIPSVSKKLNAVIARAIAKKPADRWPDAAAFAGALALVPEASLPVPKGAIREPSPGKSNAHWYVLALVAICVAGAIAYVETSKRSRATHPGTAAASVASSVATSAPRALALATSAASSAPKIEVVSSAPSVDVVSSAPAVAVVSSAAPPPPPLPPSPQSAPLPREITDYVKAGRLDSAAKALVAFRDKDPSNPRAAFLLGHVWMSKTFWTEGYKQYAQAFDLDPSLKTDPTYLGDLIKALESNAWNGRAQALLIGAGAAAIPFVDDAAKNNPTVIIRKRAAALLPQLK